MRSQQEAKVEIPRIPVPMDFNTVLSIELEYVFLRLMKNLFFLMISFLGCIVALLIKKYQNLKSL